MDGHVKIQRIQNQNRARLQMFGDILKPEVLYSRVPRLASAHEGRREIKSMIDEASILGRFCRVNGFDPTRQLQHVAQIDVSVWSAILEAFAKFDDETGELAHDGLLYITDPKDGVIKLNKPFFYALVDFLEKSGYPVDMRGKIKLN